MRREIAWEAEAAKRFDVLPEAVRERVFSALARLAIEARGDVKRLQGPLAGTLRLRVGEYRIRFRIDEETAAIVIIGTESRQGAYKE